MICTTSGTLGDPKCAMMSHRNLVSAINCSSALGFFFVPEDRYLSYVTIAHIMEQIMLFICVRFGMQLCFARFTGDVWGGPDPQLLIEDLQSLKPTIFASFPLFFNQIFRNVQNSLPA